MEIKAGILSVKNYFLWGATGQSMVLYETLSRKDWKLVGIYDRNSTVVNPFPCTPIFYDENKFLKHLSKYKDLHFAVAIGGAGGKDRIEIHNLLKGKGYNPILAVHPSATIAVDVELGEGSQVLINSTVCTRVKTGRQVIINSGAIVDHESKLGDGVHIGPGAVLNGLVEVGPRTFIGSGSVVLPRVKIGSDTIIGAGSVVTKDFGEGVVAYGNPCKIRRKNH